MWRVWTVATAVFVLFGGLCTIGCTPGADANVDSGATGVNVVGGELPPCCAGDSRKAAEKDSPAVPTEEDATATTEGESESAEGNQTEAAPADAPADDAAAPAETATEAAEPVE